VCTKTEIEPAVVEVEVVVERLLRTIVVVMVQQRFVPKCLGKAVAEQIHRHKKMQVVVRRLLSNEHMMRL
jgi:hypothetical protein